MSDDVVDADAVEVTDTPAGEDAPPTEDAVGSAVVPAVVVESQAVAVREERDKEQSAMAVLPSPGEWEATMRMAQTIAGTTFVPKAYRGNPEAVVAGILYGREIGLGPMQALQKVHIIDGKPSLAAEEMLAQMRRKGLTILKSELTMERAFIHARRSDTGEEAEVEWTIQDAIDAGLTSKDNWSKYRKDMLWARCVGRLCRQLGSDMVGGMVYAAEEMQDWDEGGYGGSGYDTPARETPVGKLTNWKDPRFDPAKSLAKDAPPGWSEIGKLVLELDPTLSDWISEAVIALYGSPVKEMADNDLVNEAWRRIANVLCRVRDELFADGDFPPPAPDDYRPLFAWAFGGINVEGPQAPFGSGIPETDAVNAETENVETEEEAEVVEGEVEEVVEDTTDIAFGEDAVETTAEPVFNPAVDRRDDAPTKKSGWTGISEVLAEVEPSLDWKPIMRQAILHVYPDSIDGDHRKLEEQQKMEAGTRAANAAGRLTELFMEEPELSALSIQTAFSEMFGGVVVDVPEFKPSEES